jgi:hypothetical protein
MSRREGKAFFFEKKAAPARREAKSFFLLGLSALGNLGQPTDLIDKGSLVLASKKEHSSLPCGFISNLGLYLPMRVCLWCGARRGA